MLVLRVFPMQYYCHSTFNDLIKINFDFKPKINHTIFEETIQWPHTWKIHMTNSNKRTHTKLFYFFYMYVSIRRIEMYYRIDIDDCWHIIYNNWELKYQPKK